jgi:ATP-dependent DNA helicase RecQ
MALPKSVEQFYQEAGRAGRDGKPADCILLWRKQDAGLLAYFANQILDSAERDRAWQRYRIIRAFAESGNCRHRQICVHFGETPKWTSCDGCDVCRAAPDWLTEVIAPTIARRRVASAATLSAQAVRNARPDANEDLREYLREWRRKTAKDQGMPAYVVLHDSSLDEICRLRPTSIRELLNITGIGERKAELYGQAILSALREYREGARAASMEKKTAPALETLQLLVAGKSLEEIAQIRGRQLSTVVNAVAGLVEKGEVEFRPEWMDRNKIAVIEAACTKLDLEHLQRLKPLKETLPPEITYDEIRLVIARMRRGSSNNSPEIPA